MKADKTLSALALCAVSAGAICAPGGGADWKDYQGGPDSSHFSSLKQITPANVAKLEVAWRYSTSDNGTYFFSPLVVDNVAFVAAKQGALVAVDATNGKELWVHSFPAGGGGGGGRRDGIAGQRGANYWESKDRSDRRIFVTTACFLYAIDARTGDTVDFFADHGKLDLKTGIDRTTVPLASRTPDRIFENLIILGSATDWMRCHVTGGAGGAVVPCGAQAQPRFAFIGGRDRACVRLRVSGRHTERPSLSVVGTLS